MEIKSLHPIRKACSYNVSGPSVLVGVVFSTGKLGPVSHLGVGEVQCINIDIFPYRLTTSESKSKETRETEKGTNSLPPSFLGAKILH